MFAVLRDFLPWHSRLNYKTDDATHAGEYASSMPSLGVVAADAGKAVSKYHSPEVPQSSLKNPVQLVLNYPEKVKKRVAGEVVAERIPYTHPSLLHSDQLGYHRDSLVAGATLCARDAVGVIFFDKATQRT